METIKKQSQPMTVRFLHSYFSLKVNRNMLLDKINNGLKKNVFNTPFEISKDNEEDAISRYVLTNWRHLSKKDRLDYCRMINENSDSVQDWAFSKKEELKQRFKDKINIFKKKDKEAEDGSSN